MQQGYAQTAADPPKFYAPKPQPLDTLYNAPAAPIEAASETKGKMREVTQVLEMTKKLLFSSISMYFKSVMK